MVHWVSLGVYLGRFPGAGIYGVSGMGFGGQFWSKKWFFRGFLGFWGYF